MQKYKLLNKISSGAFGTVYNAQALQGKLQGQTVAIKQLYISQIVKRELKILQKLNPHPNIIQPYQIIEQNNFERSIIMQKGAYNLDEYIQSMEYPINQNIIKSILRGLLQGLKAIHQQGIIHRDLKPSNILVKKNLRDVAICDFGSAVECTSGEEYQIEGFTRWYKPPEMLFGSRKYKYEVDIWSLGCIIVELATGQQLFAGKSQIQQIALISQMLGDPSPKNWPSITTLQDYNKITFIQKCPKTCQQISKQLKISKQLTNIIMRMIRYEGRATVDELLNHQYLKQGQGEGGEGGKGGRNYSNVRLELGIFGTAKIEPKVIR